MVTNIGVFADESRSSHPALFDPVCREGAGCRWLLVADDGLQLREDLDVGTVLALEHAVTWIDGLLAKAGYGAADWLARARLVVANCSHARAGEVGPTFRRR